jgi:hypothetical protein
VDWNSRANRTKVLFQVKALNFALRSTKLPKKHTSVPNGSEAGHAADSLDTVMMNRRMSALAGNWKPTFNPYNGVQFPGGTTLFCPSPLCPSWLALRPRRFPHHSLSLEQLIMYISDDNCVQNSTSIVQHLHGVPWSQGKEEYTCIQPLILQYWSVTLLYLPGVVLRTITDPIAMSDYFHPHSNSYSSTATATLLASLSSPWSRKELKFLPASAPLTDR